ncbi:MAG TPA: ribonuclease P protein component [Blastocatellia bacterium]|nr:ribonuclease P protein component [Blastocatellia bacterium]
MADCSLPKSSKVLASRDFRTAYEHGRKFGLPSFTAFVVANNLGTPRIGITASRRFGNAIERNRAKRVIRELFRCNKRNVTEGYDIIFNVRRRLLTTERATLEEEFQELLRRINQK